MFFVVKQLDGNGTFIQCLQYGGWNYIYPKCTLFKTWPSSWSRHATGLYIYLANVTSANYHGTNWEVCIGNGYVPVNSNGFLVSYTGFLYFTDSLIVSGYPPTGSPTVMPTNTPTISSQPTSLPTSIPSAIPTEYIPPTSIPSSIPSISHSPTISTWQLASDCQKTIDLKYQVSLAGGEYSCINIPAEGHLDYVNVSLYFSGSTAQEWAYDMILAIKYTSGYGIQIGGFEYYLPNITFVGEWPASWRFSTEGWYYANESVSSYNVKGKGSYNVCIVNGWKQANTVNYAGHFLLDGLTSDCTASPTIAPTPSPSSVEWELESDCNEVIELEYDLRLSGYQSSCYTITSAAGFIQNLNMSLFFSGSVNGEYPSDLSLSTKFEDGTGFRIGGFDDNDPDLEYLGGWPPSWRSESDGLYTAYMNISSAKIIDSGKVEVCIANGWEYAHSVNYDGHFQLFGLKRVCDDKKKNSNNDDEDNQMAIALGLSIPLILISLAIGGYFLVKYLQAKNK